MASSSDHSAESSKEKNDSQVNENDEREREIHDEEPNEIEIEKEKRNTDESDERIDDDDDNDDDPPLPIIESGDDSDERMIHDDKDGSDSSTNVSTFICAFCRKRHKREDIFLWSYCQHEYGRSCARNVILSAIQMNHEPKCACIREDFSQITCYQPLEELEACLILTQDERIDLMSRAFSGMYADPLESSMMDPPTVTPSSIPSGPPLPSVNEDFRTSALNAHRRRNNTRRRAIVNVPGEIDFNELHASTHFDSFGNPMNVDLDDEIPSERPAIIGSWSIGNHDTESHLKAGPAPPPPPSISSNLDSAVQSASVNIPMDTLNRNTGHFFQSGLPQVTEGIAEDDSLEGASGNLADMSWNSYDLYDFICQGCGEKREESKFLWSLCEHKFHQSCAQERVVLDLTSSLFPTCVCGSLLMDNEAFGLLPRSTYQIYVNVVSSINDKGFQSALNGAEGGGDTHHENGSDREREEIAKATSMSMMMDDKQSKTENGSGSSSLALKKKTKKRQNVTRKEMLAAKPVLVIPGHFGISMSVVDWVERLKEKKMNPNGDAEDDKRSENGPDCGGIGGGRESRDRMDEDDDDVDEIVIDAGSNNNDYIRLNGPESDRLSDKDDDEVNGMNTGLNDVIIHGLDPLRQAVLDAQMAEESSTVSSPFHSTLQVMSCLRCHEQFTLVHLYRFQNCRQCIFCKHCARKQLDNAIQFNRLPLKCMECRTEINSIDLQELLPEYASMFEESVMNSLESDTNKLNENLDENGGVKSGSPSSSSSSSTSSQSETRSSEKIESNDKAYRRLPPLASGRQKPLPPPSSQGKSSMVEEDAKSEPDLDGSSKISKDIGTQTGIPFVPTYRDSDSDASEI